MAIGNVKITLTADDKFSNWIRNIQLAMWRDLIGWRRFFCIDWWSLKLKMTRRNKII
jgi:hypothetical protein